MIESFWSTMQRELLDTRSWHNQEQLASAVFEWIEAWYNPVRRHSGIEYLSPTAFEPFTPPSTRRHDHHTNRVRRTGSGSVLEHA